MTTRRPGTLMRAALAAALALCCCATATALADDLDQSLDDLGIAHGQRVIESGHIDVGPKFDGGTWRLLIHDDVAKSATGTSVWRYPDETVLHVLDEAKLSVPDDPAYSFLGQPPGSDVWVVPQTQNSDVVWLGWNTQDPAVMERIDRGATLSLLGTEGPGDLTVYLQSGSFGDPQVLWDSRKREPQPFWVDVNTHTHANWVFSEPGVYLISVQASADLIEGTSVSDTQVFRMAVGTDTDPASAFAAAVSSTSAAPTGSGSAAPAAAAPAGQPTAAATDSPTADEEAADPLVPVLVAAIAVVAAGLVVAIIVVVVRGARARSRGLDGQR